MHVSLDGREDKSVSTNSLVGLAGVVLKNNLFHFKESACRLHDEGLEAVHVSLDGREDKSVSTNSLVGLAEVVLKNNLFEFTGSYF